MTSSQFLRSVDLASEISSLSAKAGSLDLAVAYVTKNPPSILNFASDAARGRKKMRVIVGISNQFITNPGAVQKLISMVYRKSGRKRGGKGRFALKYYDDPRFHPKLMVFRNHSSASVIVGSSNLTMGAHGEGKPNVEANIMVRGDSSKDGGPVSDAISNFNLWWKKAKTLTPAALEGYRKKFNGVKKTAPSRSGNGLKSRVPSQSEPNRSGREFELIIDGASRTVRSAHALCMWKGCKTRIPITQSWAAKNWECDDHAGTEPNVIVPSRQQLLKTDFLKKKLGDEKLAAALQSNVMKLRSRSALVVLDGKKIYPSSFKIRCSHSRCSKELEATADLSVFLCARHFNYLDPGLRKKYYGMYYAIPKEIMEKKP